MSEWTPVKVKFFVTNKGWGFLIPKSGGKDIFIHITALKKAGILNLDIDQSLEVLCTQNPKGKGLMAAEVRIPPA